ncbi:hypothetical protein RQ831_15810 [Roseomonas gilardii]|uniref:Uncharacterized protein n=1 Tax=Roseomonas gilardii TaxID=257708 RepID=A0ABU3MHZ5_9PROT|nr:hypothetical protein [Roseomonas gilardii]MDT8332527.1 hypothetical protein [Roseomonas gilardii]
MTPPPALKTLGKARFSFADARACVRSYGCTITRRPGGEFRVNYAGGSEATAYYTHDLEDACGTARRMFKAGNPAKREA